jgi:RNA polymerase sigma factor (sigma-70 family)
VSSLWLNPSCQGLTPKTEGMRDMSTTAEAEVDIRDVYRGEPVRWSSAEEFSNALFGLLALVKRIERQQDKPPPDRITPEMKGRDKDRHAVISRDACVSFERYETTRSLPNARDRGRGPDSSDSSRDTYEDIGGKKHGATIRANSEWADHLEPPVREFETRKDRTIQDAVAKLTERQQEVLWATVDHINGQEIADMLGISRQAVNKHYQKAKAQLRSDPELVALVEQ